MQNSISKARAYSMPGSKFLLEQIMMSLHSLRKCFFSSPPMVSTYSEAACQGNYPFSSTISANLPRMDSNTDCRSTETRSLLRAVSWF